MMIEFIIDVLKISLATSVITGIGGIFGFITSFLSVVITKTYSRKALFRWRVYLWYCMLGLWIGVILIILDLIKPISIHSYLNLGTKFGILAWVLGLSGLMWIFFRIARLETIIFNKPSVNFQKKFIEFGGECIDRVIKQPFQNQKPVYPIILAADESWRPWRIAEKFSENALNKGSGIIWFWFARPPHNITKNPNRVDIDCFSAFAERIFKDDIRNGILYADPRNPHEMNKKYEEAIEHLKKSKCLCVIYDALSDFLYFSDEEIAAQYLRHNMFWEEKNHINSLYIFRTGTLKQELEGYILWFANSVITLTTDKQDNPIMKTRGLFNDPRCFKIDYDLNLCEISDCNV
ncbi:hypothetical protein [Candidatus Methanocrinis natronophilus]|uniref:DUF835 domain-containing protein n=1 Tax=Candidatus Methanocrinis natronophilus TaxID=3033396 RepID=A0ABT5X8H4_9EURY|nr:hypothetical protein [Candidatus Methanocrinis natronophilus]MDF0590981.1 hypothetical protein [Candidatus Methanocrinis natronophilus]